MNSKKIGFLGVMCFLWSFQLLAQTKQWASVFYHDSQFAYFTSADGLPSDDWRNPGYDDTSWNEGVGGIGYGDGDDGTVIEGITAVFLRKEFTIVDVEQVDQMALSIDYDDAFVAYLNGQEIARSNGLSDPFPPITVLSSAQHEALLPEGSAPETFLFDKTLVSELLHTGGNLLAIQVHNATATSSDLSSSTWFHVGLNGDNMDYLQVPEWFSAPIAIGLDFETRLPILVIETLDNVQIVDDPKVTAHMGIIHNENGELNSPNDPFNNYDGLIGIEVRGNSTQQFPKKPYDFETRDEQGENLNVSLLGMPEENDWILRADYLDHTFMRNSLAMHMSRSTGNWACRTRHVEVIVNGEYMGIYELMEEIKRDNDRMDLATLRPDDIAGEELTGGYIWKVDGFSSEFGSNRNMVEPDFDEIMPEQLNYIRDVDDAFRDLMSRPASVYADPNTGYVEHIVVSSFVKELIVHEAMRNSDAFSWSAYFHKDKNSLIEAGPVWDFDQSAGNSSYPDNGDHTQWLIFHPGKGDVPDFWRKLLNDPFFKYSLKLRWEELRAAQFSNENLLAVVDSIAQLLAEPQTREFQKWNVLGENVWRETQGYQQRDTYQKEVDYLKDFLTRRWQWIDDQLSVVSEPAGYPEIIVAGVNQIEVPLRGKVTYIDLNQLFSYPYASGLTFELLGESKDREDLDINDGDSLEIELTSAAQLQVAISAMDTYGNQKSAIFEISIKEESEILGDFMKMTITVSPNPVKKRVQIVSDYGIAEVNLYSLSGRRLLSRKGSNKKQMKLDVDGLGNGLYFMVVIDKTGKKTHLKLVKD